MVNLTKLLDEHAMVQDNFPNIYGVNNDEVILDYLIDTKGREALKSFDETPENTGIAMFYDCPYECKDIVIIFRLKGFKRESDNGLFMMVYRNAHYGNVESKNRLIYMIEEGLQDKVLSNKVIQHLEGHIVKSIQINV
jgi:hypothetical protein